MSLVTIGPFAQQTSSWWCLIKEDHRRAQPWWLYKAKITAYLPIWTPKDNHTNTSSFQQPAKRSGWLGLVSLMFPAPTESEREPSNRRCYHNLKRKQYNEPSRLSCSFTANSNRITLGKWSQNGGAWWNFKRSRRQQDKAGQGVAKQISIQYNIHRLFLETVGSDLRHFA